MTIEQDVISEVVAVLKKAKRRNKTTDWKKIDRELRSIFAELTLVNTPVVRGTKGKAYHQVGAVTANITEARALLSDAKRAFRCAKSLPTLLANFAARTYGDAGLSSIPWEDMRTYADLLAKLEPCLDAFDHMHKGTLSKAGKTQGMKGPLLQKVVGAPRTIFLQRLIQLWRGATGRNALGEDFEGIAEQLIEAALPSDVARNDTRTKGLKRQIENAKRRGPVVQTGWTHITEVMNEMQKRPTVRRGRR